MKVFKYKGFANWMKMENIQDSILLSAVEEMTKGMIDVNLGGGLYKKRISRPGRGKSGGHRTLIAFKQNELAIFIYGFSKNERANINIKEKEIYKKLAKYYFNATESEIEILIEHAELIEVLTC